MDCPYCHKTMEPGWIEARCERLSWTPYGEKKGPFRWSVSQNGVPLGEYYFFQGAKIPADYCPHCGKIILAGVPRRPEKKDTK